MQLIDIPGVGKKNRDTLKRYGITSVDQLLEYYPRTHRNYRLTNTKQLTVGQWVMLTGTLSRPVSRHTGRVNTQISIFKDESGNLSLRWFNSPFITRSVKESTTYLVMGKVESFAGKLHIVNPTLKVINTDDPLPQQLLQPIYSPLGTLKSGHIRNIIKSALNLVALTDPLSAQIIADNHLYSRQDTLYNIHFPKNKEALDAAIHRLGFDELVALQSESIELKESMSPPTDPLLGNQETLSSWINSLSFSLTTSQKNAIQDVTVDLTRPRAMHRLLCGDVGSGKTIVAAAAALWTYLSQRQTLILAPTQILAEQLKNNLTKILPNQIKIALITRTQKGDVNSNIIVGTHALLSDKYHFTRVGLIVIDEQHRFGVRDRETLRLLSPTPHLLMMSATPIPRTLAMTTLSHLDVTKMTDMPKNRLPVKTYIIDASKRDRAYQWMQREIINNHQQAFIVTPLIEQANNQEESPKKALRALESELKTKFPKLKIGYVHGQMKEIDKSTRLQAFRDHKFDVLVATSMIEVGIDIPNANLMLIENAELFGLATLHQLRGRVGRGGMQGHTILVTNSQDPKVIERLSLFARETNGAKLAQYDLTKRGAGEIFGTLQSGGLGLRFASLDDPTILQQARKVAASLAQNRSNAYNTR